MKRRVLSLDRSGGCDEPVNENSIVAVPIRSQVQVVIADYEKESAAMCQRIVSAIPKTPLCVGSINAEENSHR